jgi:hypothetical protein
MKTNDKYIYVPIIKNNDNTPSINIKFKTCYDSKLILSQVFIESEPIEFNIINELSISISLNCKIRCIIRPTKLWVSSSLNNMGLLMKWLGLK